MLQTKSLNKFGIGEAREQWHVNLESFLSGVLMSDLNGVELIKEPGYEIYTKDDMGKIIGRKNLSYVKKRSRAEH